MLFVGIVLFLGLVIVHELGHFITARRNGVEAEEFGIGFPPRIWRKRVHNKKGDFTVSLNILPLGGFVKLKGEHDYDERKGSFGAANLRVKTKVLLAGVVMNLVVALVLFTFIALIGMPQVITKDSIGENQFNVASDSKVIKDVQNKGVIKAGEIENHSPAQTIDLQKDDQIISVAGVRIDSVDKLRQTTQAHAGQNVNVVFMHEDHEKSQQARLNTSSPYLGVGAYSAETGVQVRRSTWSAPIVATGLSIQITKLTFKGLGTAIKGLGSYIAGAVTGNKSAKNTGSEQATKEISGPVGIFFILQAATQQGFIFVLFINAIISLTLAIMNVLPVPALDGGRLYLILWYRKVMKKELKVRTEERIVGTSFALLLALFLLITAVDIRRFF